MLIQKTPGSVPSPSDRSRAEREVNAARSKP